VKKYGSGALEFVNNTEDITAYSPDLKFGTSDFTVECWVRLTQSNNQGIFQLGGNFFTGGCVFVAQYLDSFNWGWNGSYGTSGSFLANGQWIHIALVRQLNELKLYVNGTQNGSTRTYSGNITDGICRVGGYYDNTYGIYGGNIDDFRVSNKAVYTSNFTPPTGPLPIDTLIDGTKKGGLVWLKRRNTTSYSHYLFDTERGVSRSLSSDTTGASTNQSSNGVSNFAATGFTITRNQQEFNNSAGNYVSWIFRKQAKFFDVVTYTGNGSTQTINHNLGSIPGCIIVKTTSTDSTYGWCVFHRSTGSNNLRLNSTEAAGLTFTGDISNVTSSSFNVSSQIDVNFDGRTYVAYIFAHDAGGFGLTGTDNVISCGSFTTNANGEATIDLGYEPQWIMVKGATTTNDWAILDNIRGWTAGGGYYPLYPNTSGVETDYSIYDYFPLTSTGFKFAGTSANGNKTFIYIAIRRGPMKTPTSGTSVYNAIARTGNGSGAGTSVAGVGFSPDLLISRDRGTAPSAGNPAAWFDRLRGPDRFVASDRTTSEFTNTGELTSFNADGVTVGASASYNWTNANTFTYIYWFLRRAPGFFDIVCYTGAGTSMNINHNLGVPPEMMIIKRRSAVGTNWCVYHNGLTLTESIYLNSDSAKNNFGFWGVAPTSSVFSVNSDTFVSASGATFLAYLFATLPGISKVGSYTGTGVDGLQINCGFTAGARFVMIKRTDSANDWHVFDTVRGINAGADPYLKLNTSGAEVTGEDIVDTYASGFVVNAYNGVNANGGTYIFLAIA
jgi:hypothetical protein